MSVGEAMANVGGALAFGPAFVLFLVAVLANSWHFLIWAAVWFVSALVVFSVVYALVDTIADLIRLKK